jgi:hypothetical protein
MKPNRKIIEQKQMKEDMKKCPECAEIIKEEARVCRFCGYEFYKPDLSKDNPYTKNNIDIDEEEKIKNMKCPQCDFENEEGSKFCKNCNVPLGKVKISNTIENPYIKIKKEKPETKLDYLVNKIDDVATKFHESRESSEPYEIGSKKGTKQLLGLIGSTILFIGVFTPILSIPIMGDMNYFQNGEGDGTIILVLAIISFIVVLLKMFKVLWFTGLGSIVIMFFTFVNIQTNLANTKIKMETELAGNPFRGLADMAMQSVQIQWGWALLIVGAVLVIASAAIKE